MHPLARRGIQWMVTLTAALAVASPQGHKQVSSEKQRLPVLGDRPEAVLALENLKGTVKKVDLEKRTVTVAHPNGDSTFGFSTAAGREKISLSKKVAKALNKKSIRLEEIPPASKVKVAYYPAIGSIMEITIEELGR